MYTSDDASRGPARGALRYLRRNLVAYLALFVALGGTSYAAVKLPAKSVGTKQLKSNAVTSAKVKNKSLRAKDFAAGQLPVGERGPAGPAGPAGPQGARGPSGATNIVTRKGPTVANPGVASSTANCQAGERPVGGGGTSEAGFLWESIPAPEGSASPTGWIVRAAGDPSDSIDATAWVVCAAP
jgi:hypothetical protein